MPIHHRFEKRVFGPIATPTDLGFKRADLEIFGIRHAFGSYTALVFLNNPDVDSGGASKRSRGYAGTFSIFGHGGCLGDAGHCDVENTRRRFDDRPSHPLTPGFRRLIITKPLRKTCRKSDDLTITIVACSATDENAEQAKRLIDIGGLQISTFR